MRFLSLCLPVALAASAHWPAAVQAEPPGDAPSSEAAPGPTPSPFSAQTPQASPELTELTARLQALDRIEQLDDSVRRPLDFARAALERSRGSRAAGDPAAEARTEKLARAAVELAEARLRLLRERALFLATRARHSASETELATARRALELERARALELERGSAAP